MNFVQNHQNTEITPNTTKTPKSHQTTPKHPNHTQQHQNTQITPLIPKYLSRARPSQNRRACEIWVGHALQKEGPLQEKKNMLSHPPNQKKPPTQEVREGSRSGRGREREPTHPTRKGGRRLPDRCKAMTLSSTTSKRSSKTDISSSRYAKIEPTHQFHPLAFF